MEYVAHPAQPDRQPPCSLGLWRPGQPLDSPLRLEPRYPHPPAQSSSWPARPHPALSAPCPTRPHPAQHDASPARPLLAGASPAGPHQAVSVSCPAQPGLVVGLPDPPSPPAQPAVGRGPLLRASAAPGQVISVWEVFSGKASLTLHLGKTDLCTLPGVDVVDGPLHWDLTNEGVMKRVFKWIRDKNIQYVHLGTPCTSFSMALRGAARTRSKSNVLGDLNFARDKTANTLVHNSVRIIRYMERLGRFWSLENPLSSLIWLFPRALRVATLSILREA